jgi:hypothetical protein
VTETEPEKPAPTILHVRLQLPLEMRREFKAACSETGISMAKALRRFIAGVARRKIKP